MTSRKEKFKKDFEKAELRCGQLTEMGFPEEKIIQTMMNEGYSAPVMSKLFGKSGRKLPQKNMDEDEKLAKKTMTEQRDGKKPIRAKEIEDAAWFHNLLHDVGKYVYHKMVQYVDWTDEDMVDYEKARKKLTGFINSIHALIEDSGKIQRLEDEKTLLEMKLMEYQHILKVAVKRVQMLSGYNDVLISCMTPESRLRAMNQMIVVVAMKMTPEAAVKAEAGVKSVG